MKKFENYKEYDKLIPIEGKIMGTNSLSFLLSPGTENNAFIDDDVRIEIKKFLIKNGVDVSGLRDSELLSKVEEIDK